MAEYLEIHPVESAGAPDPKQAVDIVRQAGVIAYPTDSCYALGCHIGDKDALERIRRIRGADKHHHFTLVCRDLAEIARYARVDNWQFRLLKALHARALHLPAASHAGDAASACSTRSGGPSASACRTTRCRACCWPSWASR